ncbi:hypothetical protein A8F23_36370, partial [Burkholderia cenocepacia]
GGQFGGVRLRAGIEKRGHRVEGGEMIEVNGRHDVVPSSGCGRARAPPHRRQAAAARGRSLPAS